HAPGKGTDHRWLQHAIAVADPVNAPLPAWRVEKAQALGLLAARGLGLAEAAPAVQSAQAKLERVMPRKLKNRIRALGETVTLDLSRSVTPGDNTALLALSAAAHGWQRVHLSYCAADGEQIGRAHV